MFKGWYKKHSRVWSAVAIVSLTLVLVPTAFVAGCRFNFWSGPAELYLTFGLARWTLGDKQGATQDYTKSIQVRRNSLAFRWRGLLHSERKENLAAIEDFTQAIAIDPHSEYDYNYRGEARATIGDQKGAVKDFDQAIMLNPRNARYYDLRAQAQYSLGDPKSAVADLDQSIRLNPYEPWSHCTRGSWLDGLGNKNDAIKDFDQAIKIDSKYAWSYSGRGKLRSEFGDIKGAIADLDEAIRLDKNNHIAHFYRGNARLANGDRDGAVEDFKCAARLDPKYSAYYTHGYGLNEIDRKTAFQDYRLSDNKSTKPLSAADLAHGEKQLKAMLHDRPPMANYTASGDLVWKWTVRQFAGESIGSRIFWEKQPPSDKHAFAQNHSPNGATAGGVKVQIVNKDGKPFAGEELWSGIIVELYNIRGGPQFTKLSQEVSSGKLTKEEYIRKITCVEFQAGVRRRIFYRTVWLPHSQQFKHSATDSYWDANGPDTAEAWFAQFQDRSSYPFHCYGISYDELMAAKLKDDQQNADYEQSLGDWCYDNGDFAKALPHYKRALAMKEKILGLNNLKLITSLNNLAGLFYKQRKYADAVPLYTRALSIREENLGANHPDVATSLCNLAVVHSKQSDYAAASQLYKRALDIRASALGPHHPEVANTLNHLARMYYTMKRYADAATLYERALTIDETALGPNHPDVKECLKNLAIVYRAEGKNALEQPLYERAMAARKNGTLVRDGLI